MELLIFKTNNNYLRFTDTGYEFTGINKATVFPFSDKEKVMEKFNSLKQELNDLLIKKLTITESDYL